MGKFNFGGTPLTAVEKLRGQEKLAEITKAPERITQEESVEVGESPPSASTYRGSLFSDIIIPDEAVGSESAVMEAVQDQVQTRADESGQAIQKDLESGATEAGAAIKALLTDAVNANQKRLDIAQRERAENTEPNAVMDQEGNLRQPDEVWSVRTNPQASEESAGVVNGGYPVDGNFRVRAMALAEKVTAGELGLAGLSAAATDNIVLNTLSPMNAINLETRKPKADFLEIMSLVTEDAVAQLAYDQAEAVDMNPSEAQIGDQENVQIQLAEEELKGLSPFTKDKGNKDLGMRINREYQKYVNSLPDSTRKIDEYEDITPEQATALGDIAKELYYSSNKTVDGKNFMVRQNVIGDNGKLRTYFSLTPHGANMIRLGEAQRKGLFGAKVVRPSQNTDTRDRFEKKKNTRNVSSKTGPAVGVEKTFESIRNLKKVQHVVDARRNKIVLVTALPVLLDGSVEAANSIEATLNHVGQDKVNRIRRKAEEDIKTDPRISEDMKQQVIDDTVRATYDRLVSKLAQDIAGVSMERGHANSLSFYIQNFSGRIAPKETTLDLTTSKTARFVTRNVVPAIIDVRTPRGKMLERNARSMYASILIGKSDDAPAGGAGASTTEREFLLETQTPKLYAWGKELRIALNKIPDSKIEEINVAIDNKVPLRSPEFPTIPALDIKNPDLINAIKDNGEDGQMFMDSLVDFANYVDFKNKINKTASPYDSDYQFTSYLSHLDDGKTNGAATIGMQVGSRNIAFKTGVLRSQNVLQLDENKDIRDELQDILLEDLDQNGFSGTFSASTTGLLHDIATQLFSTRGLNKITTMTFGYGKELESFKQDIREYIEIMSIEAQQDGANYNPVAQLLEAVSNSNLDKEPMEVLVDIMHDKYIPGLVQVLDSDGLKYRNVMRSAATLFALSNELFTIQSPTGSTLSLGGAATLGSIESKPFKVWDKDIVNKKGEMGDYRSAAVEYYGEEMTSAASKSRTSSTGEVTYTPGERAYGGSVPAPVHAVDAATVVLTTTGKSWDKIMQVSKGNPYIHPIYDAVKTDIMSYGAVVDAMNSNWYDINMKWSALEEVQKSLEELRKQFKQRYGGRSDNSPLTTNEWAMASYLLEPTVTERGDVNLSTLGAKLDKILDLPVLKREPVDLNVKILKGGKTYEDGRYVPAFYNEENNTITIDEVFIKGSMFEDKAWTKPKVEGVKALPEDQFQTPEEWYTFILGHEIMHTRSKQRSQESKADYENRINNLTLKAINSGLLDSSGNLYKFSIIKDHPQVQTALNNISAAMKKSGYDIAQPTQGTVGQLKALISALSKEINLAQRLKERIASANEGKKDIDKRLKQQIKDGFGGIRQYQGK